MRKSKILAITLFVTFLVAGAASAKMYKWVDQDGVIHFSDRPPQDTKSIGGVDQIPTYHYKSEYQNDSSYEAEDLAGGSYEDSHSAKETNQRKTPKVELYTTSWCPYCEKARDFFRSRGIPFTEYDVDKDKSAARRKRQLDFRRGVPFAIVNGQRIHGFSEVAYVRALEKLP